MAAMRRRYRADTVLRFAMLVVSAVLLLAWFYKALTVKDNLLAKTLSGRDGGGTEAQMEDALSDESGNIHLALAESVKSGLARGIAAFLRRRNPFLRFAAQESMAQEPADTIDPDPAYADYLARQKLMNESWYLALYGDENSLAEPLGPLGAGDAEGAGAAGAGQSLTEAGQGAAGAGQGASGAGQGLSEAGQSLTDVGEGPIGAVQGLTEAGQGPIGVVQGLTEAGQGSNGAGGSLAGSVSGGPLGLSQEEITFRQMASLTPAYHRRDGLAVTGTAYVLEQLNDFDFLMQNFYSVHASTTVGRDEIDAAALLARDLSIEKTDEPQILIYHTHSQETFRDYGPENPEATVVGLGTRLTELLQDKGYEVIHDTTAYDIMDGELDRNYAYNYALDGISAILQENPSIQVVLDIHRDGVNESVHLVTEIDGKPAARIMFFNGMSQTPDGPIEYLPNPFKEENLAFSLQMQLDAAAYYPGFTRKIYLKGLRYNLHVRPRSALIEVGAQTNTYEEALNAMEPLAELLDMTLGG